MTKLSRAFLVGLLFIGYADDVAALAVATVQGDGTAITADVISTKCQTVREKSAVPPEIPAHSDQLNRSFSSPLPFEGRDSFILRSIEPLYSHMSLLC